MEGRGKMETELQQLMARTRQSLMSRRRMLADLRDSINKYEIDSVIIDEPSSLRLEIKEGSEAIRIYANDETLTFSWLTSRRAQDRGERAAERRSLPLPRAGFAGTITAIRQWSLRAKQSDAAGGWRGSSDVTL